MKKRITKIQANFYTVMDYLDSDEDEKRIADYIDWACKNAYEKGYTDTLNSFINWSEEKGYLGLKKEFKSYIKKDKLI